ncbi:MAG: hypothetical protein Q9192_003118 [Flavoplaca navasiana]
MVYANPGGFNFGATNLDAYGISLLAFIVVYTVLLYAACIYLWFQRHHPIVKMRKVGLMLLSVLVIHVFCFMDFSVYTMNGKWPCNVEFWSMSLYLPIGIGLWQAQNQQLIIVSREQTEMSQSHRPVFKPLLPPRGRGTGTPSYWFCRLKTWYRGVSSQGKYEGFVLFGIIVQFAVSMVIYNISRKFSTYGIVEHHTTPGLCRRGWEWAPSVIWQFLWNYLFGPYLLWKIRMIHDIYHWRLQTIIAIVAGLPGTPLWFAAVSTDRFAPINKYWLPSMWLAPGMLAMEIVTVAFPIYQIIKHKRAARELRRALTNFDQRHLDTSQGSFPLGSSAATDSITCKSKGKMYPMKTLDLCLAGNHEGLQIYASCQELNGENIIFLTQVLAFRLAFQKAFNTACRCGAEYRRASHTMFRKALVIFVTLIHCDTAAYPINIESMVYHRLMAIFGPATAAVASCKTSRRTSSLTPTTLSATPWDDAFHPIIAPAGMISHSNNQDFVSIPLNPLPKATHAQNFKSPYGNDSHENITTTADQYEEVSESHFSNNGSIEHDPLGNIEVPADFDGHVFDAAYQSVRYMVWSETWQRYCAWRLKVSGAP